MTARIASTGWPPASTAEEAQSFHDVDLQPTEVNRCDSVAWLIVAPVVLILMGLIGVLVADMLDRSDDLELAPSPAAAAHTHLVPTSTTPTHTHPEGFAAGIVDGYCNSPRRFGQTGPRPGCTNEGSDA